MHEPQFVISKWIKLYNYQKNKIEKVGIMVGVAINGIDGEKWFNADYSICDVENDVFNEELAKEIAFNRAVLAREKRAAQRVANVVQSVGYQTCFLRKEYIDFCNRCERYFKNRLPIGKAEKYLKY